MTVQGRFFLVHHGGTEDTERGEGGLADLRFFNAEALRRGVDATKSRKR
jgi:hypothetical protein